MVNIEFHVVLLYVLAVLPGSLGSWGVSLLFFSVLACMFGSIFIHDLHYFCTYECYVVVLGLCVAMLCV